MLKFLLTWKPGTCDYQTIYLSIDNGPFQVETDIVFQDENEYPIYVPVGTKSISVYIASVIEGLPSKISETITIATPIATPII